MAFRLSVITAAIVGTLSLSISVQAEKISNSEVTITKNKQSYKISAGSLEQALNTFGQQANIVLFFSTELTKDLHSNGLDGLFTKEQGLEQLLSGSNLVAIKQDDGGYVIKRISLQQSAGRLALTTVHSGSDNITEGTDSYITKSMNTATKMNLDVIDTPQSISVITSAQIEDFQLTSINKILGNTVGVTVEKMESDRTQFTSRGFEIKNFLIDGLSLPLNYSYQYGDIDMALYDHVEITRGATGLTSPNGDPSATINMIRKRPTTNFQTEVKLSLASWSYKRADVDISGAVNNDKSIRVRAILAFENADSYLDRYETDSNLISTIIEVDIADNILFTAGITRYEDNNQGTQWGGIPAFDGIDYDISTNAATDWSYRDVVTTDMFMEVETSLTNDWQLKSTYAYKDIDQDANLANLWAYGDELQLDGVQDYQLLSKEHLLNVTLNGLYSLFNQKHEIVFGLDLAKRDVNETSNYDQDILGTVINLATWDGTTVTPVFDDRTDGTDYTEEQSALFFATNIHLLDNLNLLLGSRISNWKREGTSYWDSSWASDDEGVFTPHVGVLYKLTNNISTYASYTTTFKPQSNIDENGQFIDPAEGINYEIGIKSLLLNDKLNTSFAMFTTTQDNVASWAGQLTDGRTYYVAEDGVETKGFEVEISGSLTDTVETSLGYTSLTIEDSTGEDTQTYIPTKTVKASITYKPEFIPELKVGASLNWKNATSISLGYGSAEQGAYTLLNLMANYQINNNLKLALNLDNLTDKKYYGSLIKPYITYGEPRNIKMSLAYQF